MYTTQVHLQLSSEVIADRMTLVQNKIKSTKRLKFLQIRSTHPIKATATAKNALMLTHGTVAQHNSVPTVRPNREQSLSPSLQSLRSSLNCRNRHRKVAISQKIPLNLRRTCESEPQFLPQIPHYRRQE